MTTRAALASVLLVFSASFVPTPAIAQSLDDLKKQYRRPLSIPFQKESPYSPQIATLGKKLFFDPRLSGAKNMSCATCHNPSFGYEAPVDRAVGAANVKVGRHAPTILNAAWIAPLFWDGRAATLEQQAAGPITAPVEMNMKFEQLVPELGRIGEYKTWFERLFPGTGLTRENILVAIATYERTAVADWAPFDRWVEGDEGAISDGAKRGFQIFNGKALCARCHVGWNFTDNKFHDIGILTEDVGRAKFEPNNPHALHAFKTPGLRNLTQRAPFSHNGSQETLEGIVRHYETGGIQRPSLSPLMQPVALTDGEREDLLTFLRSLTAEKSETPVPVLPN
ncbi:MAG: cytochrome-c peroxidase [Hyphomicrobiaceae bacterium]